MIRTADNAAENNALEFYDLLYSDVKGSNSFGQIVMRSPDGSYRDIKAPEISSFTRFMANFKYADSHEYYYAKNPAVRPGTHAYADMYCYSNIVIDIDNHTPQYHLPAEATTDAALAHILGYVAMYYLDQGYAAPNAVVATGRGYQFVWHYKSIAKSLGFVHDKVADTYCNIMASILSATDGPFFNMHVDLSASKRAQGIYRMPGSTNKMSSTKVRVYVGSHVAADFIRDYDTALAIDKKNQPTMQRTPTNKKQSESTPSPQSQPHKANPVAGTNRVNALIELARMRGGIDVGSRETYMYCLLHAMLFAGWDEAHIAESLQDANTTALASPLTSTELESMLEQGLGKRYNMRTDTIRGLLSITDAEYKHCWPKKTPHNAKRDLDRKAVHDARAANVMALHRSGQSNSAIARDLHLNRRTVAKIIAGEQQEQGNR